MKFIQRDKGALLINLVQYIDARFIKARKFLSNRSQCVSAFSMIKRVSYTGEFGVKRT